MPKLPEDRMKTFELLHKYGKYVPDYGKVKELLQRHNINTMVIVYLNENSLLMRLIDAYIKYHDNYASIYIHTNKENIKSKSSKMIQIGDKVFWFDFISTNDWRSNQGDYVCKFVASSFGYNSFVKIPLFSIDYVISGGKNYAIDFDLIPGAKNTTLDKIISRKEVVKLLKAGVKHYEEDLART